MFVYFNCTRFRPGYGHVSDVEQEVHDVAVLHDVFLALDAYFTGIAARLLRTQRHIVVVLDDLGADESFSKSVWMIPAVSGAFMPRTYVQARDSSAPVVKNVSRFSNL